MAALELVAAWDAVVDVLAVVDEDEDAFVDEDDTEDTG